MPKMIINGREIEFEAGMTVLQVAEKAHVEVPVFCYHPKLSIAGNCRMCLVEKVGAPKPIASCAEPAMDGMIINTNTPYVEKARKGVLEFLLINHPLDCPICDQGGECDLQDITLNYGAGLGRYHENKRAVKEKNFGPLIRTEMTRCIHCTRCIRFSSEIAGVPELGATGRGEHMEVGTYIEKALTSELSGNMIDICPVGALTSKPYAFSGRPWELSKTDSIDVLDAVGSHIRVDSRGTEVVRILPRLCEEINEEWIADKTRFACDGLKTQRLDRPYLRNENGKLEPATWDQTFEAIQYKVENTIPQKIAALMGDLTDVESAFALQQLLDALKVPHMDCRLPGVTYDTTQRAHSLFNTTIMGIESSDACLLIGTNPRHEAPLVNTRLRKQYFQQGLQVGVVGPMPSLTYPAIHIGSSLSDLEEILSVRHPFSATLKQAKNPMLILGETVLAQKDGAELHAAARSLAMTFGMLREDWNGFNVLQTRASAVGGLDLNFLPKKKGMATAEIIQTAEKGALDILFLLGVDTLPASSMKQPFVVYIGHHGDVGAHHADVVLPGAAYTEKSGTYVNLEGRIQKTQRAVFAPGDAREDWTIIRALGDVLKIPLPFDSLDELRQNLIKKNPIFKGTGMDELRTINVPENVLVPSSAESFDLGATNFYMTDVISRHSPTMAKCVSQLLPAYQETSR